MAKSVSFDQILSKMWLNPVQLAIDPLQLAIDLLQLAIDPALLAIDQRHSDLFN